MACEAYSMECLVEHCSFVVIKRECWWSIQDLARKTHPSKALGKFVTSYADTYDSNLFHES
jgi:hypothetical protein